MVAARLDIAQPTRKARRVAIADGAHQDRLSSLGQRMASGRGQGSQEFVEDDLTSPKDLLGSCGARCGEHHLRLTAVDRVGLALSEAVGDQGVDDADRTRVADAQSPCQVVDGPSQRS